MEKTDIIESLEGYVSTLYKHLTSMSDDQVERELSEAGYDARFPEAIIWAWARGFTPNQSMEVTYDAGTVINIISGHDPEARQREWALGRIISDAMRDAHVWVGIKALGKSAHGLLRQDGRTLAQLRDALGNLKLEKDGPSL